MTNFPDSFSEDTQQISAERLDETGAQAVQALAEKGYEVHAGLTSERAEAIMSMALEPAIREYCPNDCGGRFASIEATKQWLAKHRGTFLLLKRTEDGLQLAGYGWVGLSESSHVPGGETTFSLRVGEIGQGQGLAAPFTQVILAGSAVLYGAKNIWLETWASNGGAVHVYHKVGFVDVDEEMTERPTTNGGAVPDTRLYMSFPNELLPTS